MAVVELVLAIVPTVELCYNYGKILVDRYKTFQGAKKEIGERVIQIQSRWQSTRLQLEFLTKVWDKLDIEHQTLQQQVLQVLVSKLQIAIAQIEKVERIKPSDDHGNPIVEVKRWKYMLHVKESLDKAITELESWHKIFDPSWFLILRIADPLIDTELSEVDREDASPGPSTNGSSVSTAHRLRDVLKSDAEPDSKVHIFLPENGLAEERDGILFSTAKVGKRSGSNKLVILDSQPFDQETDVKIMMNNVRSLARKLRHADPHSFNLLACLGVIKILSPDRKKVASFDYVFKIPEGMSEPRTLRSRLFFDKDHCLSDRFRIAKQLAKSVSYLHTYDFVHKNIRPETILALKDGVSDLGSLFLIGFEAIRKVDGRTWRSGDTAWEKNLYRHPQRQGLHPDEDYTMQHDIYSLGVCLLEIGVWGSFVDYETPEKPEEHPEVLPVLIKSTLERDADYRDPLVIKEFLTTLARESLPLHMGNKYSDIVLTCLTCLDEDNTSFGDESEFLDEDGILIGVRYIEKILLQLEEISI